MRHELQVARLREAQRLCVTRLREATEDLIKHQDSVAELAPLKRATQQDRVGLSNAQARYDTAVVELKKITTRLLWISQQ